MVILMKIAIVDFKKVAKVNNLDQDLWTAINDFPDENVPMRIQDVARINRKRITGEQGKKIDANCLKYTFCPENTNQGIPVKAGDIVYSNSTKKFHIAPVDGYLINGVKIEPLIDKEFLYGILVTAYKDGIPYGVDIQGLLVFYPVKRIGRVVAPIPDKELEEKYKEIYRKDFEKIKELRKHAELLEDAI
jgi:hypothetical protein